MFNLSTNPLSWTPDGLDEPIFHYSPAMAGEGASALENSNDDNGKFSGSRYSFGLVARCIKDIDDLSIDGVPVEWDLLDLPAKIALLRCIPASWFQRLVNRVGDESEISQEEERDTSE